MSTTMLTILGAVVIVLCSIIAMSKKTSTWVPFAVCPLIIAILAGFGLGDISGWIHKAVQSAVTAGMNVIFAVFFFILLNKVGVFDVIVTKLLGLVRGNVYAIYLVAMILGAIGQLSASSMTAIIIAVPAMLPLFKKLNLDRRKMLLTICCGAMPINNFPWGSPANIPAYTDKVDPGLMTQHNAVVILFTYVLVILMVLYFAKTDYAKNRIHIDAVKHEITGKASAVVFSDPELARPNRFWINFIILILTLLCCLLVTSVKSYIVFAVATAVTIMVNYKTKELSPIVHELGDKTIGNLLLIFAIAFMVGVLRFSGMIDSLAGTIVGAIPNGLLRFFPAFWGWLRPVLDCFIPYQAWESIPPLLLSIGEGVGMDAYQILSTTCIACFGGVPCSPLIGTSILGCQLAEIDMMDNMKHSLPWTMVLNFLVLLFAIIIGVA